MSENLTTERLKYIIGRLVESAFDAAKESKADRKNEFAAGRRVAYYEMLDVLRSELETSEQDLKEFGLDIDLETLFA